MSVIDHNSIICDFNNVIKDERSLRQYLFTQNFPPSLHEFLIEDIKNAPLRYFVQDDSGSMQKSDGKRYDDKTKSIIKCTRWNELLDTIKFQMHVSNEGLINSKFRFLNGGSIDIGVKKLSNNDLEKYFNMYEGMTPLCRELNEIINEIKPIAEKLRNERKFASITISTDGEASDGDLRVPFAELKNLPVKITLRLCTNEDKVVNYWNAIDKDLEMNFDTVDDYVSEAKELQKVNTWFTYGLPMHRAREYGLTTSEIDKLDENRINNDSIIVVSRIIFGKDNIHDKCSFTNDQIKELNKNFNFKVLNILTGQQEYWVKETAMIEPGGCCIIS